MLRLPCEIVLAWETKVQTRLHLPLRDQKWKSSGQQGRQTQKHWPNLGRSRGRFQAPISVYL